MLNGRTTEGRRVTDDARSYVDSMFDSMFGKGFSDSLPRKDETLEQWQQRMDDRVVPEEFKTAFTVLSVNGERMAGCNKCGALVYQTALDRHVKFHQEMAKEEEG